MFNIYGDRDTFYQWDTGQRIIVEDDACCEVHIYDPSGPRALPLEVHSDGDLRLVDVPDFLLQSGDEILVWAFVKNEKQAHTKESRIFPVHKRAKPADYVYTETEILIYKTLADRIDALEGKEISAELIARAVADYLKENPISTGFNVPKRYVELLAANWVTESEELHSQVVSIDGVTENSKVNIEPSEGQLIIWREKDLAFTTKNSGGVVTVYAIGQRPENDYTVQVTLKEVEDDE